jgi:hypothetical protein
VPPNEIGGSSDAVARLGRDEALALSLAPFVADVVTRPEA